MLKVINIILFTLISYNISVSAVQPDHFLLIKDNSFIDNKISNSTEGKHKIKQCGNEKKEQGSYNVSTQSISSNSSSGADYHPAFFFNNSIFSGNNDRFGNGDDEEDDDKKNNLYKANEYYYNVIPDNTKDIDVIILLVNGLVTFLSSSDITFNEGYNEFIKRLHLIILFITNSAAEKYCDKVMMHIRNNVMHEFQVSIFTKNSLFFEELNLQQKQKIIKALPKKINSADSTEEYYKYIEDLKIFLQKLIVGFIWVNDLSASAGGELIIDTDKIIENSISSKIKSLVNLRNDVYSNRNFFKKNKDLNSGCLRKNSKKYKKKFVESNFVYKTHFDQEDKPINFLSDLLRKTLHKRLIEKQQNLKELPDSAVDIINIIAKGFNFQKIILFLERFKSSNINKFLTELDRTKNNQINAILNETQNPNDTVIFLQLDIKEILKFTILEQIKLGLSRKILAEIIVDILDEESNEIIYQLKTFSHKMLQVKGESALENNLTELCGKLSQFLYSVSCNNLSNDRILFFLDLIDESHLYDLANNEGISYEKFNNSANILQNKKKIFNKILANSDNFTSIAMALYNFLSEDEKVKVNNYFNNICTTPISTDN